MSPIIPAELEPEVPLDLQYVFDRAYDAGPYALGAVDYAAPPPTPLADEDRGSVRACVAAAFSDPLPNDPSGAVSDP